MTETTEKAEKPQPKHFGRKLYLVPLVFALKDSPPGYAEKLEAYWGEVRNHLRNLEARFGKIGKVYHESVPLGGEEGLKLVEQLNEKVHRMLRRKCQQGAEFVALEDRDLFEETMDWRRCLAVVLSGPVLRKVSEFYQEASRKRYELMAKRIDETLKDEEAGVLIIGEDHAVQFPPDIQVFYVAPPALDELHRLLREQARASREQASTS
ncbi:MAG TPA: hypothetical protein EYP49_19945 [Anaerolineae bacterium]|nr:hypothetical protein [Anaerolineae bacterium]